MINIKFSFIGLLVLLFFEEWHSYRSLFPEEEKLTLLIRDGVEQQERELLYLGHTFVNIYQTDQDDFKEYLQERGVADLLSGVSLKKVYKICSLDSMKQAERYGAGEWLYIGNCSRYEFNQNRISRLRQLIFQLFDDGCFYGIGDIGLSVPLKNGEVYFGWLDAYPKRRQNVWIEINHIKKNVQQNGSFKIPYSDTLIINSYTRGYNYNFAFYDHIRRDTLLTSALLSHVH